MKWMMALECPKCAKAGEDHRRPGDPSRAVKMVIICPDCDDGGFHEPSYYNADGVELDWETGKPFAA